LVKKAKIPLLLSKDDTYRVASRIHDRVVKIRPEDTEKIRMAKRLINNYADIRKLLKAI